MLHAAAVEVVEADVLASLFDGAEAHRAAVFEREGQGSVGRLGGVVGLVGMERGFGEGNEVAVLQVVVVTRGFGRGFEVAYEGTSFGEFGGGLLNEHFQLVVARSHALEDNGLVGCNAECSVHFLNLHAYLSFHLTSSMRHPN